MPERATGEFWAQLKPIASVFKPDALPESYAANAPTDDDRYYVPITETVSSRPLWISPSGRLRAQGTPWRVFFNVKGPLIWLDEEGKSIGHFDVHDYIAMAKSHYEKVGLGAGLIEQLFR